MQKIRYATVGVYRGDSRNALLAAPLNRGVVIMKDSMRKRFCISVVRAAYIEYVLKFFCRETHFISFAALPWCHFALPFVHVAYAGNNSVDEIFAGGDYNPAARRQG